jgi:hypothetical protein
VSRKTLDVEVARSRCQRDWIDDARKELLARSSTITERDQSIGRLQDRINMLLGAGGTPAQMAELFAGLAHGGQAQFLNRAGHLFAQWGAANLDRQCLFIANGITGGDPGLDDEGRRLILKLWGNLQ